MECPRCYAEMEESIWHTNELCLVGGAIQPDSPPAGNNLAGCMVISHNCNICGKQVSESLDGFISYKE